MFRIIDWFTRTSKEKIFDTPKPTPAIKALENTITGNGVQQLRSDQAYIRNLARYRAEVFVSRNGIPGTVKYRTINHNESQKRCEAAIVATPAHMARETENSKILLEKKSHSILHLLEQHVESKKMIMKELINTPLKKDIFIHTEKNLQSMGLPVEPTLVQLMEYLSTKPKNVEYNLLELLSKDVLQITEAIKMVASFVSNLAKGICPKEALSAFLEISHEKLSILLTNIKDLDVPIKEIEKHLDSIELNEEGKRKVIFRLGIIKDLVKKLVAASDANPNMKKIMDRTKLSSISKEISNA